MLFTVGAGLVFIVKMDSLHTGAEPPAAASLTRADDCVRVSLRQASLGTCLREQMPITQNTWPRGGIARPSCCWGESVQ